MHHTSRRLLRTALVLPIVLLAGDRAGTAPLPITAPVGPSRPADDLVVTPGIAAAAVALRSGDWDGVRRALAASGRPDAALLEALYAHALDRPEQAIERLGPPRVVAGPLADWALWVLADAHAAGGREDLALAALDRLIAEHGDSPLAARAAARAAGLAHDRGDLDGAAVRIDRWTATHGGQPVDSGVGRLAWTVARELGDPERLRWAARRLLVDLPGEIVDDPRLDAYAADPTFLGDSDLVARAANLLARDDAGRAWTTLEAVTAGGRDLRWRLTASRALVALGRSREALAVLDAVEPAGPAEASSVAWARAAAYREAARVVRGRANLDEADRRDARQRALAELVAVVRLAPDAERSRAALVGILAVLEEQDAPFEATLPVLREMLRLDPRDDLAARQLWERGWREYRLGNESGAIGYWSELWDAAPSHRFARAGRYWSGRAFERLGQKERARDVYTEVAAADTSDFYRRHALSRLGGRGAEVAVPVTPTDAWPSDPLLARARFLSDAGLDGLAEAELGLLQTRTAPRATAALRALVTARRGDARGSMAPLRDAFPALGTPRQASVPPLALELYYPLHHRDVVARWAAARELPEELVMGVIRQESAFDVRATSRAGARGLMQLMPATAKELAGKLGVAYAPERLYQPELNLQLGTRYLQQVIGMFDGNVELGLAGYNGGPYRIRRWWREAGPSPEVDTFIEGLPLDESRSYVKRILLLSDSYRRLYASAG